MKVIGTTGSDYICIVSHAELEKVADKYYGKMEKLKIGDETNLGSGYDFRAAIGQACKGMTDAERDFDRARATLTRFAVMVATLPADEVTV